MRRLIVVAGVAGLCLVAELDRAGREAIGAALPVFVTIAALLALGALADAEGLFERAAARVGRLRGNGAALYAGCAALVVATTALFNVDTAVVFVTPSAASAFGGVDPDRLPYLLLGLNLGPNLAVTGSLSALLWWTSAGRAGVRPSVGRFSALGAMTTVPALALAFLGLRGLRS